MKYIKIIAMLLLPLIMVACSDDEDINGGNAKVGFANSEISLKENRSELMVPITVSGEHTGMIKVTVQVKDVTGVNLEDDSSIIVTSKDLLIPAGTETVNVEIRTNFNTSDEDDGRSFSLLITSCEGATIEQASCKVNVIEAVDAFDKLPGTWTFTGVSKDGTESFPVTVTAKEDGSGYDCVGFMGYDFCVWEMNYSPSKVEIVTNKTIVDGVDFGDPLGISSVSFAAFSESGLSWDYVPGIWSDDLNTIEFSTGLAGAIFKDGSFSGYIWFGFNTCTMTR